MGTVNLTAPEGFHWMQYEDGPVLMIGEHTPHEGSAESVAFEVVEEHDPDRLPELEKGEEWDKIYNAILERTGDKELAAATATARAGSRVDKDSYEPPKGVQEEAARGLEMRREHGRGGTEIGVARARNLSNGDNIPLQTINRMVSFFARHEVDLKAPKNRDRSHPDYPGAGLIAWKLWGGDAAQTWSNSISQREAKKSELGKASKEYLEEALKLARGKIPKWAYAKIHQAARSKAGGKRKYSKGNDRAIAVMAISQMQPDTLSQLGDKDILVVWEHLLGWFKEHKADEDVYQRAIQAAMYSTEEMDSRGMKCGASDLVRESKALYARKQAQLKKLNKSTVPIHNPEGAFVFVVEEPNEIDKARGSYLVGQDGKVFNETYLAPLNLSKSDICVVDVSQIPWLETKRPREVIALGRVAKQALGALATCSLPHPKAVRRFGDSGEVERKLKSILKRNNQLSLDATRNPVGYSKPDEDKGSTPDLLIEKQERSSQVLPDESEEKLSMIVPIAKADQEKQIVYGVVLDPYQVDSQDDWVSPKAIEETAHRWLAESRVIGLDHSEKTNAFPVESYMVPYPSRTDYQKAMDEKPHRAYTMPFGDDVVHSGSWVLGTKLGDLEWKLVQEGELNAYSIGGYGNRSPTAKSQMPEVEFIELKEEL